MRKLQYLHLRRKQYLPGILFEYNAPMEEVSSFGYWVRRRRKALDMTQRELADVTGCALVTLKKIELDERRPSVEMAERLAGALKLDLAERDAFIAIARGRLPAADLAPPAVARALAPRDFLPAPATPLVGREGEIATVLALLEQPDVRLVTLLGPGGMGKTRLALAVGEALLRRTPRPYRSGILFVDLAVATSAEQLVLDIAAAVGFKPDAGGNTAVETQLAGYLRERPYLLILDNLEQVQGAAGAISRLLGGTLQPRFLVTSRQRLGLSWEHVVSLPGLAFPHDPADDPAAFPSGRLFLNRAGRILPGYELQPGEASTLAHLCALVDGMPLALELAAAWVDTLRLEEIVAELSRDLGVLDSDLEELPQRHRSLRAVWESTWERLEEAERTAFARLSVFQGGFTRGAAEAVAGASLGTLAGLTGRYLVGLDRAAGRYRLHELLRQFGYAKLVERGEAEAIHRLYFDFYCAFAREQMARLRGRELSDAQARFVAEMDNLTCALDWGLRHPEVADETAALFNDVAWHWRIRSQIAEASAWSARVMAGGGRSSLGQAQVLLHDGQFTWMRGDAELARNRQLAALSLLAGCDAGDPAVQHLAAEVNHHLAMALHGLGQTGSADALLEQSVATFRQLDDRWWLAFSLSWLSRARYTLGDIASASAAREEYSALAHSIGNPWLPIHGLHHAEVLFDEGRLQESRTMALNTARNQRLTGHLHSLGQTYILLGRIDRREGDEAAAGRNFEEAIAVFESIGHERYIAEVKALMDGGE